MSKHDHKLVLSPVSRRLVRQEGCPYSYAGFQHLQIDSSASNDRLDQSPEVCNFMLSGKFLLHQKSKNVDLRNSDALFLIKIGRKLIDENLEEADCLLIALVPRNNRGSRCLADFVCTCRCGVDNARDYLLTEPFALEQL